MKPFPTANLKWLKTFPGIIQKTIGDGQRRNAKTKSLQTPERC
jgi:hypothetical protein